MYWIPITLWSVLKMYRRTKLCGASVTRLPLLLTQPLVELGVGEQRPHERHHEARPDVLNPDHLVVGAEDVPANETLWRVSHTVTLAAHAAIVRTRRRRRR